MSTKTRPWSDIRWTPELYRADKIPEGEFGPWKVDRFEVQEDDSGRLFYMLQGRDVPAGTYTRLWRSPRTVVMSDTPAEFDDHREFWSYVRWFGGSVLIHGLGLGCAVRMALQAGAERVTVIELDQDVIDHVAPHLNSNRVTIYQGDALTRKWPVGSRWTVVWHDIWDTICSDNLPEMHRLHRRFGGRSLWQGSWARSIVEQLR